MRLLAFVVALACWGSTAAYADTEAMLGELSRKSPEERLKILTEGARKERVLSFYGSAPVSNSQDVIRAFNKLYPFIEVRYTRLGAPALVSRLSTEYQAGCTMPI